jgi:hypothetical protein
MGHGIYISGMGTKCWKANMNTRETSCKNIALGCMIILKQILRE